MGLFDFWKKKKEEAAPSQPSPSVGTRPEQTWDDAAREDLREGIRNIVRGEIRLNRADAAAILQTCREVYIEDEAPEDEWEDFLHFASAQIEEATATHAQEQAFWPKETDCDRLDRVEEDLRRRGILLWQASPCCDTCSSSELPDRIDVIEQRNPGFRKSLKGYAFYIDQNLPEMLAESTEVSLYLAYGWFSPDGAEVQQDVYEMHALSIGAEVQDCFKAHGFDVDWNRDLSKKIGVTLNWQRRLRLA